MAGFNLADLFEPVVDVVPDRTALVSGRRRLTYAELDGRANRLAHHLPPRRRPRRARRAPAGQRHRVPRGDARPASRSGPCRSTSTTATSRTSCATCSTTPTWWPLVHPPPVRPDGRRRSLPRPCPSSSVVLEVDDASPSRPAGGPVDYEAALAAPARRPRPTSSARRRPLHLYTGGTTGMPKGVMWRHEDIFFAAMGGGDPLQSATPIIDAGRAGRPPPATFGMVPCTIPPLMHASAHWLASRRFFGGGTSCCSADGRFDPRRSWQLIERETRERAASWSATPWPGRCSTR